MGISEVTTFTLGGIFVIISLGITIYNFYDNRKKNARNEGIKEGTLNTKLDQIITTLTTLSEKLIKLETSYNESKLTIARIENEVDDLDKRVTKLETKKRTPKQDAYE